MQHLPWVGRAYRDGLKGQRLALVGYSHWGDVSSDKEDFTEKGIQDILHGGEWRDLRFFEDIAGYFDHLNDGAFWDRVIFFNFAPRMIGDESERYAWLDRETAIEAGARALRIYREYDVQKALIFSVKGWDAHPATDEERERQAAPLLPGLRFPWGHYGATVAVGLRHPQFAPKELMRQAVQKAMALPVSKF